MPSEVGDLTPDFRFHVQTFATALRHSIGRRTLQAHHSNISPYLSTNKAPSTKPHPHQLPKMAADAKTEVMQQVRQQAALQNARFLVDVSEHSHHSSQTSQSLIHYCKILSKSQTNSPFSLPTESQRALLRARNPQPRLVHLVRRADQFHQLHGEVHGRVEHY
jgi:hypothetical protein